MDFEIPNFAAADRTVVRFSTMYCASWIARSSMFPFTGNTLHSALLPQLYEKSSGVMTQPSGKEKRNNYGKYPARIERKKFINPSYFPLYLLHFSAWNVKMSLVSANYTKWLQHHVLTRLFYYSETQRRGFCYWAYPSPGPWRGTENNTTLRKCEVR